MEKSFFNHTLPIIHSEVYKASLDAFLFADLCNEVTNLKVSYDTETLEEFPRSSKDGSKTRLLLTFYKDQDPTTIPTTLVGLIDERLDHRFDLDGVLRFIAEGKNSGDENDSGEKSIAHQACDVFTVSLLMLIDAVQNDKNHLSSKSKMVYDDVVSGLIASLIAIGFNDPLDVWIVITKTTPPDECEPNTFCHIRAVKPRLVN